MSEVAVMAGDSPMARCVSNAGAEHRRIADWLITVAQKLWAEGGAARFYKGFTPCLLRAFPANGIMLLTVDKVTYMLA